LLDGNEYYITGGFFDGTPDGFILKLKIDGQPGNISLSITDSHIYSMPDKSLAVPNKGFTGGTVYGDHLWVCSSNQILGLNRTTLSIDTIIDEPLLNDLHHVLAEEDGLTVVNTGLESIDTFSYEGELLKRVLLTSDQRTSFRTSRVPDFRVIDSKPHFMHANYCSRNEDGDLLVTFIRQRRIVNTIDWGWVSPEYSGPPHEGYIEPHPVSGKKLLWVTTVPGLIIASDPDDQQILFSWTLSDYGIAPGWTRGLAILSHGMLVGTTGVRKSNHDYFRQWSKEDISRSYTGIHYIPFDTKGRSSSIEVFSDRPSKVFSILPVTNE
jgi:hypothetical protein